MSTTDENGRRISRRLAGQEVAPLSEDPFADNDLRETVSNSQSSSDTQSARPLAQNIPFVIQDSEFCCLKDA